MKGLASRSGNAVSYLPGLRDRLGDVRFAVNPFRFSMIVRTTKKSDVARVRPTASPFRDFVIELEKGPGIAAPSVFRNE